MKPTIFHTIIYVTYILLFNIFTIKGEEISFGHLNKQDGLSHYSVLSIYQDERGMMWFGTNNGANLYNGKSIKTYQNERENNNSLCNNHVHTITGNRKGTVFLGTQTGISAYDIKTETFRTIFHQQPACLIFQKDLYTAFQNRIYQYDGKQFKLFYELPIKEATINTLYINQDSLLIGTERNGLYLLHSHKKLSHLIKQGTITQIFRESSGKYWITNSRDGIGLHLIENGKIQNFKSNENDSHSLTSNFTHCCCEDQEGNIWIGTFNGLTEYNREKRIFIRHPLKEQKSSLSHSSIWSLYCDHQGTIWAGTYFGGINFFNPHKQPYQTYTPSSKEGEGLSSGIICRMAEDKQHNLWICTEGGGLNKYNRQTGSFQWFRHSNVRNSISHDNVKAVYHDTIRNCLWLGTHLGGLNKLDLKTGIFTHYLHDKKNPNSLPSNIVSDIIPYKDKLLLATNNGVCLFDIEHNNFKPLLKEAKDRLLTVSSLDLLIDRDEILWIVNNRNGVCAYHLNSGKLTYYKWEPQQEKGISGCGINSVYEDSKGLIWFCTNENGIDAYHKDKDEFENFNKQNSGLSSNLVYNICEIGPDKLLLTTDKGLSILNYQTRQCNNYTNLPLDYLKDNALYQAQDGTIFIGGISGMISLHSSDIDTFNRSYMIFPSRLTVNNQEVSVGDDSGILSQSLSLVKEITLKPKQDIFHIEYAITDYIPFSEDLIYYRLKGFSDQWSLLNSQHTITYTNLNPGIYELEVKAQNQSGKTIAENRLKIQVLPPFYKTTWAYLFYLFSTAGIIVYLIKTYKSRIKLQESLKYEQKHTEDIEKLNQAKLRFFTNISHEFRTPLTLIIGQIESLMQSQVFTSNISHKINGIYNNCTQLMELINELLDFRKQEQGHTILKVSEHNIVDFAYTHYLAFQEYARQQKINFEFRKSTERIPLWFDGKQMQKVLNNLLSNAFKHTHEGGNISLSVSRRNQEVLIEVTDNGDGIAPKDIQKIFERFYQTEQSESLALSGTGIGLALTKGIVELHHGSIEVFSELHEGSTFCVHLKCGNAHFNEAQLNAGKNENITEKLPLSVSTPQTAPLLEAQSTTIEIQGEHLPKEKILIVEDNVSLCEMLASIFRPFYTIITAQNGTEGLEKVQTEFPDLILSDVIMPGMSGLELCRSVKQDINTCHIPVVLLTARSSVEHTIEGLTIGADDYITKPFNLNILLARCNNLINNRIRLQEKFSQQPQAAPHVLVTNEIDKHFIEQVMEILDTHIDDVNFKVDALVDKIGISRTRVFNKIKAITGQTPSDFIMTVRLKKAAVMLRHNLELNISEISDKLGFSTPKYFSKCFKEKYNMTPQEYRRTKKTTLESENASDTDYPFFTNTSNQAEKN